MESEITPENFGKPKDETADANDVRVVTRPAKSSNPLPDPADDDAGETFRKSRIGALNELLASERKSRADLRELLAHGRKATVAEILALA